MAQDVRQFCPVGCADDTIAMKNALACRVLGRREDRIRGVCGLAVGEPEVDQDIEPRATRWATFVASEAVAGRVIVDHMFERAGSVGDLDSGDMPPVIVKFRGCLHGGKLPWIVLHVPLAVLETQRSAAEKVIDVTQNRG
ncbi:MAG: hypothetical protein ABIW82_17940 [Dokdonella sp.]